MNQKQKRGLLIGSAVFDLVLAAVVWGLPIENAHLAAGMLLVGAATAVWMAYHPTRKR